MRRHDLDWISLIAGLVFAALAVTYLVASIADVSLDGRFVWPAVFIALGAAGVATAITAAARQEKAFAPADSLDDAPT